jgi:hypothetical protein
MKSSAFVITLVVSLLSSVACGQTKAKVSEMPYAGAPCTAIGGIGPSAAQVANFRRFDGALRAALKQRNATALSFLVRFPLRVNTGKGTIMVPDAQSLSGHFAEVFPPQVREAVIDTKDDDYICKYDEGLAYMNGWVWASMGKDGFRVDVVNAGGEAPKSTGGLHLAYTCESRKHRIVIDASADGNDVRYRSWNKPKAVTDKPDVDLSHGVKAYEGTGVCAYTTYTFKTKNVVYEVDAGLGCGPADEAKTKATGSYSVTIDGTEAGGGDCF